MNSTIWMVLFFASQAQKNAGEAAQPSEPLITAAIAVFGFLVLLLFAWLIDKTESGL